MVSNNNFIPNPPAHPAPDTPPGHPHDPPHPNPPLPPMPPEKPEDHIIIIVNGIDKALPPKCKRLSYEDVVKLAYGEYIDQSNVIYTVVYSNGPAENKKGTLVKGGMVLIQKGMIFNVGRSDKS